MQVTLNEIGYVSSFAWIGNLLEGTEVPEPAEPIHFAEHYTAYKLADGKLVFDTEKDKALQNDAELENLRQRREKECFSVINRGQLWYEGVSITQLLELRNWYRAWLKVTETGVIPERPTWIT